MPRSTAADPRVGRAALASFYAARVSVPDANGRVLRTLAVAPLPMAVRVAAAAGRVLVASYATLDSGDQPVGDGAVTGVDAATLGVRETVAVGAFLLLRAACATIERGTGRCALRKTARE